MYDPYFTYCSLIISLMLQQTQNTRTTVVDFIILIWDVEFRYKEPTDRDIQIQFINYFTVGREIFNEIQQKR